MYAKQPKTWHQSHAAKQAYIALGIGLVAAAEQKVDATPMEGFDSEALDVMLGLADKGLKSQAILALGYRDEANDWLVNMKKVRTPADEFFIKL
jgi:nitroreductase